MSRARVLLADDHTLVAEAFRKLVEPHYEVVGIVADGRALIAAARSLKPDVIVTQSQCEVCAVSLSEVEQAVGNWVGFQPRVLSLAPNTLADVWNDILKVAGALGVAERGVEVVARLKDRVERIAARTRPLPQRPSVACIEWLDPLMAAGNWVPELVELAGGLNLFGEAGKHTRIAVGANELPMNAAVELVIWAEVGG